MTKKSAGRVARDKLAAEKDQAAAHVWDELAGIYHGHKKILADIGLVLKPILAKPEVFPFFRNTQEVTIIIKTLASDMKELSDRLDAIYAKHSHLKGGLAVVDKKDPKMEEFFESVNLGNEYVNVAETISAAIKPNVEMIIEEFFHAEVGWAKAKGLPIPEKIFNPGNIVPPVTDAKVVATGDGVEIVAVTRELPDNATTLH